jgi:hypothetical protein
MFAPLAVMRHAANRARAVGSLNRQDASRLRAGCAHTQHRQRDEKNAKLSKGVLHRKQSYAGNVRDCKIFDYFFLSRLVVISRQRRFRSGVDGMQACTATVNGSEEDGRTFCCVAQGKVHKRSFRVRSTPNRLFLFARIISAACGFAAPPRGK